MQKFELIENVTYLKPEETWLDIGSNSELQAKMEEIEEYCTTIKCMVRSCPAYMNASNIEGFCHSIYHASVMLSTEVYDLKKIALESQKTQRGGVIING